MQGGVCDITLSLQAPVIISSEVSALEEHNGPCLPSSASDPPDYALLLTRQMPICLFFLCFTINKRPLFEEEAISAQ